MAPLNPQAEELQRRFRFDTPFWAGGVVREPDGSWRFPAEKDFRGCVQIINKRRLSVPCIAHPWQLEFDDILEDQRARGLPMRVIILKARKLGFSTWVAVKFLQRLTQLPYQMAIVTAQDTTTAGLIFDMAKHAYTLLPNEEELGLGFSIKPHLIGGNFSANGRKFLEFGEPSRKLRMEGRAGASTFEIDTANSPEKGRGGTPNMLHLSEVARWAGEQATKKMLSQLNAVPYEPETIVVLESTAAGLNHYHRRWVSAREGALDPDTGETYVPLFVPWWRDPGCSRRFETQMRREEFIAGIGDEKEFGDVAEDEVAIMELYSLTPEQLYWRRMMIRTQHEGSVQLFKQENPASDEEAFIGSGRTVFASILVTKAIKDAEAAPAPGRGSLVAEEWETRRSRSGTIEVPRSVLWVPSDEMQPKDHVLEVWEHPRPEPEEQPPERELIVPTAASNAQALVEYAAEVARREGTELEQDIGAGAYVVAADVAEGEVNTFTEGDLHVATVFDHHTRMQVAVHASRMDPHDLPLWLLLIAIYYNRALLVVESNGPGVGVVDALHRDYRYQRMYRRERIDRLTNVKEKKPGWKTDLVTKPAIEATFGMALAEGTHGLRDLRTARELSTYVITERGKHEAAYGEHDDRLMAAMIGHRAMETTRPPRRGKPKALRKPDDELTGY